MKRPWRSSPESQGSGATVIPSGVQAVTVVVAVVAFGAMLSVAVQLQKSSQGATWTS